MGATKKFEWWIRNTVWFFTFEILYDNITQREIVTILYYKKFVKAYNDAFDDV